MYKLFTLVVLSFLFFSVVGCSANPPVVPTATALPQPTIAPKAIVLGEVSDEPAKKIKAYQPLADYLAANLGQFGVTVGEVKVAPDQETMIQWLKDGSVDLYFASPYSAMIMNDQAGAPVILRYWKSGVAEYKSLILVRKDSGIKSLADLKGHVIAFDEPYSTTAYMLPLAYIIQDGLNPVQVAGSDESVPTDEVGYVFAQGQDNVTAWLVNGKVSAGAFSDQDIKEIPADIMDQLTILIETEKLPRYLALARPGMDQAQLEAIKVLLIGLDQTPEGPDILKSLKTAKFDELPNPEAMLTRMRELYDVIAGQ